MNNIKFNILVLGIAGLTLAGCSDSYLDTGSKTDMNATSFYKTQAQADYAVIGCYDTYQRTVSNGSWPTLFQAAETMSDDCFGGGGPDDRSDRLMDRFSMSYKSDAVSLFNGIWGDYYKGIYNCNLLIASLNNISWSSPTDRIVAEMKLVHFVVLSILISSVCLKMFLCSQRRLKRLYHRQLPTVFMR